MAEASDPQFTPADQVPWIDPVEASPAPPALASKVDSAICEEVWLHMASTCHRRDECPVEIYNEAEIESEREFMRRSPDHAASL